MMFVHRLTIHFSIKKGKKRDEECLPKETLESTPEPRYNL